SHNDSLLQGRGSKFESQKPPPLLITNRSYTLSRSERETAGQILTGTSMQLSARELVDKFYSLLNLRVTKRKRQKSVEECLDLFHEGFTVDEIDYAISWLLAHHPTTGSFSRLPHFIDQALKARHLQSQVQHSPPPDDRLRRQQEREQTE